MQEIIIREANAGQRLNKFLGKYLDTAPQSFIYKMLRKKNIKWNHEKATGNEILSVNDCIQIYMTDETIAKFRKDGRLPELEKQTIPTDNTEQSSSNHNSQNTIDMKWKNLKIMYEDADILILNKPAGVLSQKAAASDYSLNEWVVDYYRKKKDCNPLFTPSVCNRLDRNTSGIILAGMSLKGSRVLSHMLKKRTLDKYYLTIVAGRVEEKSTIKGFLTKKASHNQVVVYQTVEEAEKNSMEKPAYIETLYEPVSYGHIGNLELTLLNVKLITGKTHQIRAHLRSIGHPIIGDGKYGFKTVNAVTKREFGLRHQLLHAYKIIFPEQEEELSTFLCGQVFCAELPEIFQTIKKVFE